MLVDSGLAAVLAFLGIASSAATGRLIAVPLVIALAVPVVFRRAYPVAAFAAAAPTRSASAASGAAGIAAVRLARSHCFVSW